MTAAETIIMKQKKLLGLLMLVFLWIPLSLKAELVKCIVLISDVESPVYFPLTDEPTILFKADKENPSTIDPRYVMEITTEENSISVYTFNQNKLEIQDVDLSENAIDTISEEEGVKISGDSIIINVNSASAPYQIVNMNGIVFKEGTLSHGTHTLRISELGSGIYILKVNNNSIKIKAK